MLIPPEISPGWNKESFLEAQALKEKKNRRGDTSTTFWKVDQ